MRLGLAQINTIVGDLAGNREKIIRAYKELCSMGAELVLFPELALCGYPPRDLLFKRQFVSDVEESLIIIANEVHEIPAVLGFTETRPATSGRPIYNAAAFCRHGEIEEIGRKCLLSTYGVFDESRYFSACPKPKIISFNGKKIGITISEDIWTHSPLPERTRYQDVPLRYMQEENVDLVLNLSASPWYSGKGDIRRKLVSGVARFCNAPVALCNSIGGNDELIFDGGSLVANADGQIIAALASFEEELRVVDISQKSPPDAAPELSDIDAIEQALVLGLRDYVQKSGFQKVILGLSGGLDSAVVAALAVKALGSDSVIGIGLPSQVSSDHSKKDARDLAENLGIRYEELPIVDLFAAAEKALDPVFHGLPTDVTEENLQARSRGLLLMALSNKWHALLLSTGNKSELAVGYCTLYGDMCGGLAVLSDLYKTTAYQLARHLNRDREIIPVSTLTKPPSAELSPDQTDQDSLPPYEILDEILERYIEWGETSRDIINAGFEEKTVREVVRMVDLNEYKRKQAAPGLRISPLAFGVGRRLPLVQKYVS